MTDATIAKLFERHEKAKRALDAAEAALRSARPIYAANHGLLAYPTIEAMRRGVAR
ncbi:hypothetical protein [Sphingomonas sp.]|jgi:hypothetical protein|uniref:hypothetical protein n=1 Tax=Sphingomonas sp. TaxID=28214 RepID=UPI002D7E6D9F|nr:hypothetical protein [Sphingomonas sp.]HEU0044952.1 hypothetical protein [Sphingomonas sp.]